MMWEILMEINKYMTPYMRSNCYIICENGHAIIIDPCEMEQIKQDISMKNLILDFCILTHEHFDHISGLDWMHSLNIKTIASEKCNINLANPKINQSRYYEAFCMAQTRIQGDDIMHVEEYQGFVDDVFYGQMEIEWQSHHIKLQETPGHSQGSICILVDNMILFSGDTLFAKMETGTRLLGGSARDFENISLKWLHELSPGIQVYPGHDENFILKDKLCDLRFKKQKGGI